MRFGKTYTDRHKEDQKHLESLYQKRFTSFAWFPTRMCDGQWVWLEDYTWTYDIACIGSCYIWLNSEYGKTKRVLKENKS